MDGKIKVVRYSNSGFTPVFQTKMREHYDYHVNFSLEQLETDLPDGVSKYARDLILRETLATIRELDHDFSFVGVHVFIDEPSEPTRKFQLNHLPITDNLPTKCIMYLNPDTIVRNVNCPWLTVTPELSLADAQGKLLEYVFIEGHQLFRYNPDILKSENLRHTCIQT
jgi:hypothetical protein